MRIFDKLSASTKQEILQTCISYAKVDLEINTETTVEDLISYATGFGEMFLIKPSDFKGFKTDSVKPFKGDKPVWRKVRW